MSLKNTLLAAALSGIAIGQASADDKQKKAQTPKKKEQKPLDDSYVATPSPDRPMGNYPTEEYCWGINKCKMFTFCGVTKEDIEATAKAFGDKYKNSTVHNCSMMGKCSADKGILGFTYVKKGTCIKVHKGFQILIDNDNKHSIKK